MLVKQVAFLPSLSLGFDGERELKLFPERRL
jgi:hypothetical protein